MTPQRLLAPLLVAALLFAVALAACGGGGDKSSQRSGTLTDPRKVPTSTPWQDSPPEVVVLDPDQLTPIAPNATPASTGGATSGDCSPKYKIQSGDTFSAIAERCGVTTQDMRDANPGVDPATLHIGDEVNIPSAGPQPAPTQ